MSSPLDTWDSTRGCTLRLRRAQLDDIDRLLEFERHLSPGTKYFRYGRFRDLHFTPEELQWILDPSNESNVHHVVTTDEDGKETLLASARIVITTPVSACQLLIVVRDDWQGSGLGGQLMTVLCDEASRRGLPGIYCQVMPTNLGMQAFMQKCGFQQVHNPDNEILVRFEKRLECVSSCLE